MDYSRFVVGYHGCDEETAKKALLGQEPLRPSKNDYDWLGNGIYFWEQGPKRAFDFACEEAQRAKSKIKTPYVIGAYIFLGDCFDLLDTKFTHLLKTAYPSFVAELEGLGHKVPENKKIRRDGTKLFHNLDRAVIEYTVRLLYEVEKREIQTVRGVFWEGEEAFPGAQINEKSHIQIAVRDENCVLGYFRPRNIDGATG